MPFIRLNNILLGLSALLLLTNCAGPYKGRLIDEKSGAPIQGAVAVGYWTYMTPNVGGGTTHCLDARETVSDEKGDFTIPNSVYGEFFGEMNVAIYKVGYKSVSCLWKSIDSPGGCLMGKTVWEDDRAIIPLKIVVKSRLMEDGYPPHVSCGRKDGKPLEAYIEAHKEYRRARGLNE
jgi:hypothetical protein